MALTCEPIPAAALRRRLLAWYRRERRELPWRAAPGERFAPYPVWVSEIMLQQTTVAAVIPYYVRFMRQFPDLAALARAPEAEVLAAWSGLGYYRRARHLHAAARLVMERHQGAFPLALAAARALPGIGAYTAAAILSIADGQPLAAVDGNVVRVASRLAGRALSLLQAQELAQQWLAPRRAGDFNQALMDLGAGLCLPRAPQCPRCPLCGLCATRGELATGRARPRVQRVELDYVLARRGARVFLRQRPASSAQLAGLWELPEAPAHAARRRPRLATVRHAITTRAIQAHVYSGAARGCGRWLGPDEAAALPLTGLSRKILRRVLDWPL